MLHMKCENATQWANRVLFISHSREALAAATVAQVQCGRVSRGQKVFKSPHTHTQKQMERFSLSRHISEVCICVKLLM